MNEIELQPVTDTNETAESAVPESFPKPQKEKRPPGAIRLARMQASARLAEDGNRLYLLLLLLFTVTFWIGSILLLENLWFGVDWTALWVRSPSLFHLAQAALYGTDAAVVLFLGFPLSVGVIRMVLLCAQGEQPAYTHLFDSFRSLRAWWRSVRIALLALSRYVGLALFAAACYGAYHHFFPLLNGLSTGYKHAVLTGCGVCALAVLFLLLWWMQAMSLFFLLAFREPEQPLCLLCHRSIRQSRGHRLPSLRFHLSYIPAALVSVLSFLLLSVCHFAPHYLFSCYFYYDTILKAGEDTEPSAGEEDTHD